MYQIEYLDIEKNKKYEQLIKKVLKKCFEIEGLEKSKLYISITLTTPHNIQKINKEYRQIDKSTDVLSFPMFEKEEIDKKINNKDFKFEDILGDIIISIEQVYIQAETYGHSFERELSYMVVHGFYHLMGYDHILEKDKLIMRQKEENILNMLEITRKKEEDKNEK